MSACKTFWFILLYYIVWFSCVYAGAHDYPYLALAISIIISSLQSAFFIHKRTIHLLLIWTLLISFTGFSVDSLWSQTGVLIFKSNPWQSISAAPWILALWINFSILCYGINKLLIKIFQWLPVIAFFGFPLAYIGGIQLGAATSQYSIIKTSLFIGSLWSLLFPVVIYILKICHYQK